MFVFIIKSSFFTGFTISWYSIEKRRVRNSRSNFFNL